MQCVMLIHRIGLDSAEIRNKFALTERYYIEKVELTGDNTWPEPFWLELVHGGAGGSIDLKKSDKPKGIKK